MDRAWLLMWTTYGSRLPGDDRGFVSNVRVGGAGARHNAPGEEVDQARRGLAEWSRRRMTHDEVRLSPAQAGAVADQLRATAAHRGWQLLALAVMANHVHLVVGVEGDPEPDTLLRDFKAYASRVLNAPAGKARPWWTASGSKRVLVGDAEVESAVDYVRRQEWPLVVWVPGEPGTSVPGFSPEVDPAE